jgi:hypothetical protein
LQAGQSTADGALRHSSGEQPQSAQRIIIFGLVVIYDKGTVLTYTQSLHLIGKVGSVRHPRMAALEASSTESYEKNEECRGENKESNHNNQT